MHHTQSAAWSRRMHVTSFQRGGGGSSSSRVRHCRHIRVHPPTGTLPVPCQDNAGVAAGTHPCHMVGKKVAKSSQCRHRAVVVVTQRLTTAAICMDAVTSLTRVRPRCTLVCSSGSRWQEDLRRRRNSFERTPLAYPRDMPGCASTFTWR